MQQSVDPSVGECSLNEEPQEEEYVPPTGDSLRPTRAKDRDAIVMMLRKP